MYKHKGNERYLDLVKVEDNRYYFVDINTGEEVDYAESTFKRYIEEIGTMLVKDTENFSKVEIYKEVAFHGLGLRSWMGSKIGNLKYKDEEKYAADIKAFEEILYGEQKEEIDKVVDIIVENSERYTREEIESVARYHDMTVEDYLKNNLEIMRSDVERLKETIEDYKKGIRPNDSLMSIEEYEAKVRGIEIEIRAFEKGLGLSEEEGLTNDEYVILRQGNYVPSWMLGGRNRINEIREYIETDGAGYHRGTYEVQDHELANTKNINKFKQLVKEFPQILEATSSKPLGVTKVGRDLAKQFVLTGIVTLSTNGLYIKKGELKDVSTIS